MNRVMEQYPIPNATILGISKNFRKSFDKV